MKIGEVTLKKQTGVEDHLGINQNIYSHCRVSKLSSSDTGVTIVSAEFCETRLLAFIISTEDIWHEFKEHII